VYFCQVKLGQQWEELGAYWSEARIRVTLEEPESTDRAAQLLAPLQPLRVGPGVLACRVSRGSDTVKRLLERLDAERIHGKLELVESDPIEERETTGRPPQPMLREQWEHALSTVPGDWSDLLAVVELETSDWFDRAALHLAPLNPRREGTRLALRFRAARQFGYGAAPQMVARSLARCDEERIRGTVSILRALSDTQPVQTQGPVWQLEGRTV
jgi:hypothetical protein